MRGTEGEFCDMWKEELAKSQTRGPMSKRALYLFLMKCLAEEGFFSEWRTPAEIAFEANKRVSRTWRPYAPVPSDGICRRQGWSCESASRTRRPRMNIN